MSRKPGISIRQPVRAQAATFAPGNVPTAFDYGPWEANIGGFVWLSDGVTTTPFPDGWSRNGTQDQQAVERHLTVATRFDLSDAIRADGQTIGTNVYFNVSGDQSEFYEVIWLVNGGKQATITGGNMSLFMALDDFANITNNTITARIEYEDGSKERVSATVFVDTAQQFKFITADRSTAITITGKAGNTVPDLTVALSNTDNASLTYTVTDDASWLSGAVVSDVLTLSFPGANALATGAYAGTVVVSAPGYQDLTFTVSLTVTAAETYQIVSSDDAGFANPTALLNAVLTGSKYIGVQPLSGISTVLWNLDGTDVVTRTGTPWDFGAEAPATAAALYDTSVLANGAHTLTATVTPSGGQRNYILQSQTLSTSPWSNFTTTVTTGTTLAGPEGSTLMLITQNTGAVAIQHTHSQLVTKPSAAGLQWQVKLFIKPDATNPHYYFRMIVGESSSLTGYCSLYFRLDPGNVGVVSTSVPAGGSSGWSVISSSVTESSTPGIYVVSFVGTSDTAATLYPRVTWTSTAGGSSSYAAGTATGALMAWQLDFGTAAMTTYTATTTTQVIGTGGTPTTVTADFSANNPPKALLTDKAQLVFQGTAGAASPAAQTITLTPSTGTAAWTSVEVVDMTWISATASGSATPAAPSTVTVTPTTGALAAGQYTGTLRFTAVGYASVDVSIIFNIQAAAPTYALYYSPNGAGLSPVAALQGATTGQQPYIWLANTASSSVPITLAGTDTFAFWNTATTVAQEATVAPVRIVAAPNKAFPSGGATGQQWESASGIKNYHWRYSTSGGVVVRGDTTYTYGSAVQHKTIDGIMMRVDRQNCLAAGASPTAGVATLSAKENTMMQHPAVKVMHVNFAWGHLAPLVATRRWNQLDAALAKAKSYGKKLSISISHQGGWADLPDDIVSRPNGYDPTFYVKCVNWADPFVSGGYVQLLKDVFARYAADMSFVGVWTDEAWIEHSAAFYAATGTNVGVQNGAYYRALLDFAQSKPPGFNNTHFFIGANTVYEQYAPGGNLDQIINAGCGIGIPDPLNFTMSGATTGRLAIRYKGIATIMMQGDGRQYGSNFTGAFPNMPRAGWKQNVDWTMPLAGYSTATTMPGNAEERCWRVNGMGYMATLTWVQNPPADPNYEANLLSLLNEIGANGFPNTKPSSNLVRKL